MVLLNLLLWDINEIASVDVVEFGCESLSVVQKDGQQRKRAYSILPSLSQFSYLFGT